MPLRKIKIIIVLASIVFFYSCSTYNVPKNLQPFEIIELPNYFNGKGAIVPPGRHYYETSSLWHKGRFTPTKTEIIEAEDILKNNLFCYIDKFMPSTYEYDELIAPYIKQYSGEKYVEYNLLSEKLEYLENLIFEYENYYRWYIGDLNEKDEKIIEVFLFDHSHKFYEDWRYYTSMTTDTNMSVFSNSLVINLRTKTVQR